MSYEPSNCGSQPISSPKETDLESQRTPEQQPDGTANSKEEQEVSAIKGLGWLDRLLALWILLAMIIGILLGNFVDSVGPALHRGEFVGVSVPIGEYTSRDFSTQADQDISGWTARNDVPDPVQGEVRIAAPSLRHQRTLDPDRI
jgi:hypothetical protein